MIEEAGASAMHGIRIGEGKAYCSAFVVRGISIQFESYWEIITDCTPTEFLYRGGNDIKIAIECLSRGYGRDCTPVLELCTMQEVRMN